MKFVRLTMAMTIVFSILLASTVNANTFRDVPSNHFALDAIRWVSSPANGSFMVGDASNNFNPTRVMDSFETAITLAMAAGFRYSPASITPADQAAFDRAYERHRPVLAGMAAQHPNWRRAADREIAFLLELGILTTDDLANFMTRGTTAAGETASSLTKEAASAFVLRLAGFNEFPEPDFRFTDDAEINNMYRRYTYLAHYLGVVSDYDGYFTPRRMVTRAEFAQMFYALRIAAPGTPGASEQQRPETIPATTTGQQQHNNQSPFASTFHGTITALQEGSIQLTTEQGTGSIPFGTNPIVVIDDVRRNPSYLSVGMLAAVGLNEEGQIISMLARSAQDIVAQPTPTPTPAPTQAPPTQQQEQDISGVLANRHFVNLVPVLVIEDRDGNIHNLSVAADTYIVRNGYSEDWTALRIGDEIAAGLEHGRLVSIQAMGNRSVALGVVEEIHMTQSIDSIVIRRTDQANASHVMLALPPEIYDIYDLSRGMELQLNLDSREIYALSIVEEQGVPNSSSAGFIGYIQSLRHGHTIVVTQNDGTNQRRTIRVDGNTINTATDEILNFRDLRSQMRLYIVMLPGSNTAQSITVLP